MGIFSRFPYSDFHRLNADWILEKIKEMLGLTQQAAQDAAEAAETVETYGDRLTVVESRAAGAVRFDVEQQLSGEQQTRSRANIGAAPALGVVMYNTAQLLDESYKTQARSNIGAAAAADIPTGIVHYDRSQSLSAGQQTQARNNIGAADAADVTQVIQDLQTLATYAVRVNAAQTFTDAQKAQARSNIGAAAEGSGPAPVGAVLYDQAQSLTSTQQQQARSNIDALGTVSPVINGNLEIDSESTGSLVGDAIQLTPVSITGQSILQLFGDLGDNKVLVTGVADPVNDYDAVNLGTLYASILKEVPVTGNTPVIDLSSEIDGVAYETLITCTGAALTSVTISTSVNSPYLATIVFTTGSTPPTFDTPLDILGLDDLVPSANTIYEISIRRHRAVWHSWEVPSE